MIRAFIKEQDLKEVMTIWLKTNIETHEFIDASYWHQNYKMVEEILPEAEIYVWEEDKKIKGFIGLQGGYIAGLFINKENQGQGIGKKLLEKAKELYDRLELSVYQKNTRGVAFYKREEFEVSKKQEDEQTRELEYYMKWYK